MVAKRSIAHELGYRLLQVATCPGSASHFLRQLLAKGWPPVRLCSYKSRIALGLVTRPHYGYCMYSAASLAKKLGHNRISAVEFGVGTGTGLLAMERHAREIGAELGVQFEVYGFDTGSGLPPPVDYRDLPYCWRSGSFKMNEEQLRAKLERSQLVIGDVRETCGEFFNRFNPAPIGCMFFDLDFYSSTKSAFQIFNGGAAYLLPRVFLYFDDIIGREIELFSDFTGERLAIREFNENSACSKIAPCYHLMADPRKAADWWHHQVFVYHDFMHPAYNEFISVDQ